MKLRMFATIFILAVSLRSFATQLPPGDYTFKNDHYGIIYQSRETFQRIYIENEDGNSGEIMPFGNDHVGLDEVEKRLIKGKDVLLVIDNMLGGYDAAYTKLGRALRATCDGRRAAPCKVITFVHSKCGSACVDLYMYGNERVAAPYASFGFHRQWVLAQNFTTLSAEQMADRYVALGGNRQWFMTHLDVFTENQAAGTWVTAPNMVEAGVVQSISADFLDHFQQ
jgi:hypothetical protein